MKKEKNALWIFFASTKLALSLLIVLAIASVIGTLIPQNENPSIYVQQYGQAMTRFFQLLDITNMYRSWWFITLLALLSLNLIVCTFDRLPGVWRKVLTNNLDMDPGRLAKMPFSGTFTVTKQAPALTTEIESAMTKEGWRPQRANTSAGILFSSTKGAWTRLGVFVVHLSILIIFMGAIIGIFFGYKAFVMLPEGATTNKVYEASSQRPISLDFQLRCDRFTLSLYENGAPKEYRSDLTVIEEGKEKFKKSIVVNDPLSHKGITFYQASYQGSSEYQVQVENNRTKKAQIFILSPKRKVPWQEEGINLGIINTVDSGPSTKMIKLWFSNDKNDTTSFWLSPGRPKTIDEKDMDYTVTLVKQRYATGLQVAKDPGVWYVYVGCIMMLLGFLVAFFLSHKRVWVLIEQKGDHSIVLVAGTVNKNRLGFEKNFQRLLTQLQALKG